MGKKNITNWADDMLEMQEAETTTEAAKPILLVVSGGKLKRGKKRPQLSFYIPDELGDEIDDFTRGPVVARYIALMKVGLEHLKEQKVMVDINTKDLK